MHILKEAVVLDFVLNALLKYFTTVLYSMAITMGYLEAFLHHFPYVIEFRCHFL